MKPTRMLELVVDAAAAVALANAAGSTWLNTDNLLKDPMVYTLATVAAGAWVGCKLLFKRKITT